MKIVFNDQQKLNEIIFANRNKNYGAYAIRAAYNSTVFKSLSIVASTVFLFAVGVYVFTKVTDAESTLYLGTNDSVTTFNFKPLEDPKQPEPPKQNQGGKKVNGVATVISDTATVESKPELDPNANLNPNGNAGNTGTLTGTGEGTVAIVTPTVEEIPEPPTAFPEEAPEFEGGIPALMAFIKRNTVYPELAREIAREGTVYVTFIINEKGEVEDSKIMKGIGAGCDEEATRVVNKIPKFKKPGRNKYGKPVKTVFNVPFAFKLR
jgi:protein TonB